MLNVVFCLSFVFSGPAPSADPAAKKLAATVKAGSACQRLLAVDALAKIRDVTAGIRKPLTLKAYRQKCKGK